MANDKEQLFQSALREIEKQRYDQALAILRQILQSSPDDLRVLLRIGDVFSRAGRHREALGTYERVANIYAARQDFAKAAEVLKSILGQLLQNFPEDRAGQSRTTLQLGQLFEQMGNREAALAIYQEEATNFFKEQRFREALDISRRMVRIAGDNPTPFFLMGNALVQLRELDSAIEAYHNCAKIFIRLNDTERAIKMFERILHLRKSSRFSKRIAELLLKRETREDAMAALPHLDFAFREDQRDVVTVELLARAFGLIGQEAKAIAVYKEAATIARDTGDIKHFERLVALLEKLAPDDPEVHQLAASEAAPESVLPQAVQAREQQASETAIDDEVELLDEIDEIDEISELDDEVEVAPVSLPPSTQPDSFLAEEAPPSSDGAPLSLRSPKAPLQSAGGTAFPGPPRAPFGSEPELEVVESDADDLLDEFDESDLPPAIQQALLDCDSFENLGLRERAIAALHGALHIDPNCILVRERLCRLLADIGDRSGTIAELVALAMLYFHESRYEDSAAACQQVLDAEPGHPQAEEIAEHLRSAGWLSYPDEAPVSVAPVSLPSSAYAERLPSKPEASLPAFELEELSDHDALGTLHGKAVGTYGAPTMPPPSQDEFIIPPSTAPAAPSGLPNDLIEQALEEAEFFTAQGHLNEARLILGDALLEHPGHPLLLEALQEINEHENAPASLAAPPLSASNAPLPGFSGPDFDDDDVFALAANLDSLEVGGSVLPKASKSSTEQVDVDQIFAQFKEGVRAQVSDADSSTHYDLAMAYREMGLRDDAVAEFQLAARDTDRECLCWAMIGTVRAEQGEADAAIESYKRALKARKVTPDQILALWYDIALIHIDIGEIQEARDYFEGILAKDSRYRDVPQKLKELGATSPSAAASNPPSEGRKLDEAFDPLFS